jgi:hypothetical protein
MTHLNLLLAATLVYSGCADYVQEPQGPARVFQEGGTALITDRTGKSWDVTHARDEYGLQPSGFQFGIGPYAIRPIMNPLMWSPGQSGYPATGGTFLVLAANLNGLAKAYPIAVMSRHEVANETFGETHVAVGY